MIEPAPQLTGMNILLVGFRMAKQSEMKQCLANWGVKITLADDISVALAATLEGIQNCKPFHAVLVSGNDISKKILAIPTRFHELTLIRDTPLVFCPHSYDLLIKEELLAAGFHTVIPLPLDKRLLFYALHTITAARSRHSGEIACLSDYYIDKELAKRSLHILIAEDNLATQGIFAKTLERAGHRIKVVGDGEVALDELQRTDYHMLILSMHMPNMGGLDVIKTLRFFQPEKEEIPVILLSIDATVDEIQEAEELAVEALLSKPVEIDRLLDTVRQLARKQIQKQTKWVLDAASCQHGGKQVINLSTLAELETFSVDTGFVPDLIHCFIGDNEALLREMESTLNASHVQNFKDLVHGMKGAAASVGAEQLAALCAEVISTDQNKLHTDSAKTLARIAEMLASTRVELFKYLEARQSATL